MITLVAGIPAGYALAMIDFQGRRFLLVTTLVVMLMPTTTLVIPLFLELNAVHLIGTIWSIVLPYSFYPFGVYLTYIYFNTALPPDLPAAARIDGCTEFGSTTARTPGNPVWTRAQFRRPSSARPRIP